MYSICYVNGFQTQPGELDAWPRELLLQRDGEVVFDPDWPDEALIDTSSAAHREKIADTVIPWIEGLRGCRLRRGRVRQSRLVLAVGWFPLAR